MLFRSQAFASSHLSLSFNRQLTGIYMEEWIALQQLFQHFTLSSNMEDRLIWRWSQNDLFTVNSFYKWLEFGGFPNSEFKHIWIAHIPLKIKVFLWLLKRDKLLTKTNLRDKGWPGDLTCVFCSAQENADHLFVSCSYVQCIWQWIASHNNFIFNGITLDDLWLIEACIPLKDKNTVMLMLASVLWTIWLERNRICFNTTTPLSVKSIGAKLISLAHLWCNSIPKNSLLKLSLMLPSDVKDLPEQIQEEGTSSLDTAQTVDLLLTLGGGNGSRLSPMSGVDPIEDEEDDEVNWDALE